MWQAIALNTSLGIAERRGAVCALTLAGVTAELGVATTFMPDATAAAIHSAYLASGWTPRWRYAREGLRTARQALEGGAPHLVAIEACSGQLELRHRAQPIRPALRRARFIERPWKASNRSARCSVGGKASTHHPPNECRDRRAG